MPTFFIPEALAPIITTPALPFATATTRGATDTQRAAAELARTRCVNWSLAKS
jgi:hypothetical protein